MQDVSLRRYVVSLLIVGLVFLCLAVSVLTSTSFAPATMSSHPAISGPTIAGDDFGHNSAPRG